MRFPIDPPPPIGVIDDPYEIRGTDGIRRVRAINAETLPQQTELPHQVAIEPVERRAADQETRNGADRRLADRRQYTQVVLVDTRLGRDRRNTRRRPTDPPAPSIDEEG